MPTSTPSVSMGGEGSGSSGYRKLAILNNVKKTTHTTTEDSSTDTDATPELVLDDTSEFFYNMGMCLTSILDLFGIISLKFFDIGIQLQFSLFHITLIEILMIWNK